MSWTEEQDEQEKAMNLASSTEAKKIESSIQDKHKRDDDKDVWQLLEKTLSENLIEKRRARRWKIFFRFTSLAIMLSILGFWFSQSNFQETSLQENVVAMIPMRGVIGAGAEIESSEYVRLLDSAYQNPRLQGVVIEMNSPGGSPVHAGIIYDAIYVKIKNHPNIPVIVVVEDMAASGGYYIASAANEIYADKASLVGSIGVISSGFDASHLLEKIGVERRTFTAGRNKAFLDPFAPMTEEAKSKWQAVLDETHQQFITAVKIGRGDRLTITDDVFSGMVFTGSQAVNIGLIDGLYSVNQLLNKRFPTAEPVYYEPNEEPWEEFVKEFGVEMATKIMNRVNIQ
ncbi:S49 family peptidase [Marinomonas transparens]|uniref:S49 family peptidase n=1 Tax=Marinomonas transparens TaxID=2795388 RepID=A0A934N1Z4_9GAMM|nr:S49 family peptidase [Marinomonas transparens]MBJ7538237.1 S49 family peptidase [Marinomonas transparens]